MSDFLKFQKKIPALRTMFSSWNPRKKDEKERYLDKFSVNNWGKWRSRKRVNILLQTAKDAIIAMPKFKLNFQSSQISLRE